MNKPHYTEDELLQFVLQTLEPDQHIEIDRHLTECQQCNTRLSKIRRDIESLQKLSPDIQNPVISYPSRLRLVFPAKSLLKAAALLLIGFGLGFSTNSLHESRHITLYMAAPQYHGSQVTPICVSENLAVTNE